MHKAWCSVVEVPYYFSRSSIKFQGHTGRKIDDLNWIWEGLLGRSQLSNPSDLPCSLSRLFRQKSRKTSKLRVTGLCGGNSPVTVELPLIWDSMAPVWRRCSVLLSLKRPMILCKPQNITEKVWVTEIFSHHSSPDNEYHSTDYVHI